MRKEYVKPTMDVVAIEEQALLAGSATGNAVSEESASNETVVLSRPQYSLWGEEE